ncbi:MAG: S8 family serine peptidase [Acidobacteriota bacterium]
MLPSLTWNSAPKAAKSERPAITRVERQLGYLSKGDKHKLRVEDAQLARQLTAQGARQIADYGSYQIFNVDTATVRQLGVRDGATARDEDNVILLNSGALDTQSLDVQLKRRSPSIKATQAGGKPGKAESKGMHLVQFAGPVKPEWHAALAETGVEIVSYIPSNAYLVFGDAAAFSRLKTMIQTSDFVQWNGDYDAAMKMAPKYGKPAQVLDDEQAKRAAKAGQSFARQGQTAKAPLASSAPGGSQYFAVQLIKSSAENAATLASVASLAADNGIKQQYEILNYVNVVALLRSDVTVDTLIKQVSHRPDVISVAPYTVPRKLDERQNMIISGNLTAGIPNTGNYLTFLANNGFAQAGQFNFAVNISDSGVDNGTQNPNHYGLFTGGVFANGSRIIYNRLEGTPNGGSTLQGCDGHGNLNTHIIAGFVPTGTVGSVNFGLFPHADASGFRYGLGVAPFVKVGSSVIFDPNNFTFPIFADLESRAYNNGSRVSSNSWGASDNSYTIDSQAYDALVRDAQPTGSAMAAAGNQEYTIVFAAGNDGSGANTVGEPGTAKNIITAGASENVQAFGAADQCGTTDAEANNANDIVGFSSRGPTADGRRKPELVAPGTHVSGGVFQTTQTVTGNGTAGACFSALGVCAGPGVSNFWPLAQQFFTASSGTSHSTPAIAGAAALVRQRFLNASLPAASPAMTKAVLMNSARYLTGTDANDNLWSNSQGMGEINLSSFFDIDLDGAGGVIAGTPSIIRDQAAADIFTASGQQRVITGAVADNTKGFRVTVAWTDAPGPTSGAAWQNNLDLEVVIGGNSYKGNTFSGASSATGGTADTRNNVESVFIPAGITGNFAVIVKASNIVADGVPNFGGALDQDYALVIYNANQVAAPVIVSTTAIVNEDCNTDGKADPGEGLTVSLCLQNIGTANSGAITATLQATGGVTNPSSAQSYGALPVGGAAVCKDFTFKVSSALTCGTGVVVTWQLQDGAANIGTAILNLQSGLFNVIFSEKFDGVTAPALPAGWVASQGVSSGSFPLWATSTTASDGGLNNAFSVNATNILDNRLETPAVLITSSVAKLTFRNNFDLESGATVGFDGGVLEISVNGAAYVDVTDASVGGTFTEGGYVRAISTGFNSPIGGRQAWTGSSGGYINSTVQFGALLLNKTVKFRFRMGADESFGNTGWHVDGIQVLGDLACCVKITPGASLFDPLACTGPGNFVSGVTTVVNPTASALNGGNVTIALQPGLLAIPGGCTATVGGVAAGTCSVVNASTIVWTGSLAGNSTLTITYQAQVGDVQPATQLCATITGGFTGVGLNPVTACLVVNCQAAGPGLIIPTVLPGGDVSPLSDQKPGSVLLYPIYTSAADATRQNTRISLTNTNPVLGTQVHLFFVDGDTCSVADAFICLTPNQTTTFLASDLDPGTTGYVIALAVNVAGCPTSFNYLIGDEYVKFASGHAGNLGAESVPAVAGGSTVCTGSTAVVRFDGVAYAPLPRTVALDNVPSRGDGNDTLLVLDRIGGDLLTAGLPLTNLFGLLFDDAEIGKSFSFGSGNAPGVCQFRSSLTDNFPRVTPRFTQFIPAGRSGWLKIFSTSDQAIIGASLNYNANALASAGAFNGAHNLHKLTLTTAATYVVPVLPVSCQ